jgi:hypothetical protein
MSYKDDLLLDYQCNRIIPFIGSGLSAPFKLPTWTMLIEDIKNEFVDKIYHPSVDFELNEDEYQVAIDTIKRYGKKTEQDIQEYIAEKYSLRNINDEKIEHNFLDITKLDAPVLLTTNYDRLIEKYCIGIKPFNSLTEYTSNVPMLFRDNTEKSVFHIHGCIANPSSIVISSQAYENLYKDEHYDNKMKAFTSNHSFLFLGFSLKDVFTRNLLKQHKEYFKGNHYMLVPSGDVSTKTEKELREEFGVKIITYDVSGSSHCSEIHDFISDLLQSKETQGGDKDQKEKKLDMIGARIDDFSENHEDSLFYKKLKLANITDSSIHLSKLFYISAEKFIREAKRFGVSIDIVDGILAEVFVDYHEKYVSIYNEDKKNSQELLNEMHKSLEEINLERYVSKKTKPSKRETKGLIHVLAEDEARDIWWGSERFE